jgi:polysaccharide export outer membrane protein
MVELPVLGYIKVAGYKEAELKVLLEKEFSKLFNDPFAVINIENRRAFVFKGSSAQIVNLNKYPTSLIEVLAITGGIPDEVKAFNIKVIRGNLKNPEVLQVDLSTLKGMTNAELTIQANDIIYLEQRQRPVYKAIQEVVPIVTLPLTLISTSLTLILLLTKL